MDASDASGTRCRPAPKWTAALAVVFALGSAEAAAQLTPDNTFDGNGLKVKVAEGTSATMTVTAKASVPAGTASVTPVTVTVAVAPHGEHGATSKATDVTLNPGTMTLTFPANTTGGAVTHEVAGTVPLQAIHDLDAEDETVVLAVSASGGLSISAGSQPGEEPRRIVTLDDDETQSYVLALAPGTSPREGTPFDVVARADPAHLDNSKTLTMQIDGTDYTQDTDDATAGAQLSGTLDGDSPSFTAEVTPPANDGNRTEDTVTVTAVLGDGGQRHRGGVSQLRGGVSQLRGGRRPRAARAGRGRRRGEERGRHGGHVGVGRRRRRADGLGGPGPGRHGGDRRGAHGGAVAGAERPRRGVDLPAYAGPRRPAGRHVPQRKQSAAPVVR